MNTCGSSTTWSKSLNKDIQSAHEQACVSQDLVRFSARGSTGVEFLGGIQIVGENRLSRVLPVK